MPRRRRSCRRSRSATHHASGERSRRRPCGRGRHRWPAPASGRIPDASRACSCVHDGRGRRRDRRHPAYLHDHRGPDPDGHRRRRNRQDGDRRHRGHHRHRGELRRRRHRRDDRRQPEHRDHDRRHRGRRGRDRSSSAWASSPGWDAACPDGAPERHPHVLPADAAACPDGERSHAGRHAARPRGEHLRHRHPRRDPGAACPAWTRTGCCRDAGRRSDQRHHCHPAGGRDALHHRGAARAHPDAERPSGRPGSPDAVRGAVPAGDRTASATRSRGHGVPAVQAAPPGPRELPPQEPGSAPAPEPVRAPPWGQRASYAGRARDHPWPVPRSRGALRARRRRTRRTGRPTQASSTTSSHPGCGTGRRASRSAGG